MGRISLFGLEVTRFEQSFIHSVSSPPSLSPLVTTWEGRGGDSLLSLLVFLAFSVSRSKKKMLQLLNVNTMSPYLFCLAGVNHILEVYDLPKGIKNNETDELFEDLIKAGARIKWLHSSASASQGTPVLAIFSSSTAANYALNSMPSSKFKLRLHQNTSAFAHADSNAPISSSS